MNFLQMYKSLVLTKKKKEEKAALRILVARIKVINNRGLVGAPYPTTILRMTLPKKME